MRLIILGFIQPILLILDLNVKILSSTDEEINLEDLVSDPSAIINLKAAIEDLKAVEAFVNNPRGKMEITANHFIRYHLI